MADKPNRCRARQQSDQMHCSNCGLTWDMNDPEPPECPETRIKRARDQAIGRIEESLGVPIETQGTETGRWSREIPDWFKPMSLPWYIAQQKAEKLKVLCDQVEHLKACVGAGATLNEVIDILCRIDTSSEPLERKEQLSETLENRLEQQVEETGKQYCYQCYEVVNWLAPDGRCAKHTRLTPEEIRGDV